MQKIEPHRIMMIAALAQCSERVVRRLVAANGDVSTIRGANLRTRLSSAWIQVMAAPPEAAAISSVSKPLA